MKTRMNVMLVGIMILLGTTIWILFRGQKTTIITAALSATSPASSAPQAAAPAGKTIPAPLATISPPVVYVSAPATQPATRDEGIPKVSKSDAGEKVEYMAAEGDTLSNVAAALLGSDSKKNRDAVIAANPSLQADPDRVLAGKTYVLRSADPVSASRQLPSAPVEAVGPRAPQAPASSSEPVLRYTAQPGDSVSVLAADLLGGNSKKNRDAIINQNKSLQGDPDHVVAGKTYQIPASDGLSAAPAPAVAQTPVPTTQPDADGVVKSGAARELRYTARAGDNVSKLAEMLLGSDTQANRDAIISNNASLKSDPNRVIAGRTYWIPAPAPLP